MPEGNATAADTAVASDTSVSATDKPVPKPAPSTPSVDGDKRDPEWIKDRLDRERKAILKSLGVESEDDAKKAIADFKAKAEQQKTLEEKIAEYKAKAEAEAAEKDRLSLTVGEFAARQLAGLTEEQRAAVKAVAGEDANKQLKAVEALMPTWAKADAEAAKAKAEAEAKARASAPPASTTAAGAAPPGASSAEPNLRSQYDAMRARNPFAAAELGLSNPEAVYGKPQ